MRGEVPIYCFTRLSRGPTLRGSALGSSVRALAESNLDLFVVGDHFEYVVGRE
jgi:hypothetical protein